VLGADVVVAQRPRLFLGQDDDVAGTLCKSLEQTSEDRSSPGRLQPRRQDGRYTSARRQRHPPQEPPVPAQLQPRRRAFDDVTAKDWPILQEMAESGDYPHVLAAFAAATPTGRWGFQ
jgi:hypothetical protein